MPSPQGNSRHEHRQRHRPNYNRNIPHFQHSGKKISPDNYAFFVDESQQCQTGAFSKNRAKRSSVRTGLRFSHRASSRQTADKEFPLMARDALTALKPDKSSIMGGKQGQGAMKTSCSLAGSTSHSSTSSPQHISLRANMSSPAPIWRIVTNCTRPSS